MGPPFSIFFEVAIFGRIFVAFGVTFGAPLALFGLILVSFWFKLGPFWCHVGPDFGYFAPSGCSFWLVVGEIKLLRQYFAKNTPALTWHQISCKFFACKLSSLGPGAELLPQATEINIKERVAKSIDFWSLRNMLLASVLGAFFIKNR